MDPNVTLENARLALELFRRDAYPANRFQLAEDLADSFEALDQWLTKGGYLPTAWSEAPADYR